MPDNFEKKGVLKAMLIALIASLLGIGILGWQYRQIEKKRIPAIEEKIEQNSAQHVLERFLETRADRFLTEGAIEEKNQGKFILPDNVNDYKILKADKLVGDEYRFLIQLGDFTEVITMIKISDEYYIDSVEMAG